jgi:hypothetical protein
VQVADIGWLPSISHFYYTPAQQVFVAALVAASLAMIALSGRGLESVLLDVAAVFAPLIAIVPMGLDVADRNRIADGNAELLAYWPTDSSGKKLTGACSAGGGCVPQALIEDVAQAVYTYAIVAILLAVLGIWMGRGWLWEKKYKARRRQETPGDRVKQVVAVLAAPVVAIAVAAWLLWLITVQSDGAPFPFNSAPLDSVHFTVTILFFTGFTSVAVVNAIRFIRVRANPELAEFGGPEIKMGHGIVYIAVPILMLANFVMLFTWFRSLENGVFIGEAIALILFGFFWLAQTHQRWRDDNALSTAAAETQSASQSLRRA